MESIKAKILKNPKITLNFKEFNILLNHILNKNTDTKIKQNMYNLYKKLDGKKKSGINKSFLLDLLKDNYKQKKDLEKEFDIPISTRILWEKELPCFLFKKHYNFFKEFTRLDNKLNNRIQLYNFLIKYIGIKENKTIKEIFKNLPNREIKLVKDFLILKELKDFKINNRYIVYLCNRVESDPSRWKNNSPQIVKDLILISQNKPIQKAHKTKYSYKLRIKKLNRNLEKIDKIIRNLENRLGKVIIDKIIKLHNKGNTKEFLRLLNEYNKKKIVSFSKKFNRYNLNDWQKGKLPDAIRTLKKIHELNLHKINKETIARLLGWGFGDGGINKRFGAYFFCGKKEDLEKIKIFLKKELPKINIIIKNNNGRGEITKAKDKITREIFGGESWILYIRNAAFCRLLHALGLPRGEKVLQKTIIPLWILKATNKIKLEFLEGILESENQTHRIKFIKEKNKIAIPTISFGMCKEMKYEENLIDFLNSTKCLLKKLNIRCSKVEKTKLSSIRKRDGKITCFSRFHIYTSALDVINFSKVIKYKFNNSKKLGLNIALEEAKKKLKRFNKQKEKFKEASNLFNQGMNYSQIARRLDVSHITIKNWVFKKEHLPRHLNIDLGGFING
ncbi:MAG: hypothetical protein KKG75_04485 [Nanoarchaeota archaeon]|nr:hypothetical protein [Nanoarchaeota archaeon]